MSLAFIGGGILAVDLVGSSAGPILFACIAASFAALVVALAAMPPEVWRERQALMDSRVCRAIVLAPTFFLAIALPLMHRTALDLHDQLVLGPVRVTRYQLIQACILSSIGCALLLHLYAVWRSSRVKKPA